MSQAISRYANTLFELAQNPKEAATIEKDAQSLLGAFSLSGELISALKSPLNAIDEKMGVLAALGKKLKIAKIVQNFLLVVAQNGRAGELEQMLQHYIALAAKARGAIKAEVASAQKLSAAQIEDLKTNLGRAFKAEIEIETEVKPELIGGLVVKIGSRLFDDSIQTKLENMKLSLKGN
jgi:F-type H+-transporting ATPase subunit delta